MSGETLKVLIADDQPEICEILEALLCAEGHVTRTAKNGREALELACDFRPDLVFLDIMMPVLDGFAALEELLRRFPEVNVVMMTACPEVEMITRAFKEGVIAFLGKPFDMAAIREILRAIRERKDTGCAADFPRQEYSQCG
ncbi:two-component system response regulator (stage 0 sporulation protein F) [Thermodesulfitimonas autotrophica]|jgi:CheY-like chemotaxis protein|uniref:Stage 0 sporulation protein A homolog n=1 Tax=Thermodesulfitimonas autotrophica TaxID=1894989 RepID=A0A3N5AXW1_9THEO|nr:response regulator [Thermodesulfitimonas autotrophica]RPF49797.1 two-component system response regulator (stage 0 sporulation protein F) [Thermodesulfitimonas autotrophica]